MVYQKVLGIVLMVSSEERKIYNQDNSRNLQALL